MPVFNPAEATNCDGCISSEAQSLLFFRLLSSVSLAAGTQGALCANYVLKHGHVGALRFAQKPEPNHGEQSHEIQRIPEACFKARSLDDAKSPAQPPPQNPTADTMQAGNSARKPRLAGNELTGTGHSPDLRMDIYFTISGTDMTERFGAFGESSSVPASLASRPSGCELSAPVPEPPVRSIRGSGHML